MIITRIFRGLALFLGGMGIGLAIIVALLAWRLSSGPVSLAFLSPYLETALRSDDGSFAIRLDDTILTWARPSQNVEIRLRGAQAIGAAGAVVADVPELALSLSGAALLQGKLAPRSLSVFGPSLVIVRKPDGRLELGLPRDADSSAKVLLPLLGQILAPPGSARSLGYLTRLNIVGADLLVDDKKTGVLWQAPKADITVIRTPDGVRGTAALDTRLDGQVATLNVDGEYRTTDDKLNLNIGFIDIRPPTLASLSPEYSVLSGFDLPVSGTLAVAMNLDGLIDSATFNLSGGGGQIQLPDIPGLTLDVRSAKTTGSFSRIDGTVTLENLDLETRDGVIQLPGNKPHRYPLRTVSLAGSYFFDFNRLDISDFTADLDGPTVGGAVTLRRIGSDVTINLDSIARDVRLEQSARYWPPAIAPIVRPWIVGRIPVGNIIENRMRMDGRWNPKDGLSVEALSGDIKFDGVSIDYLPPLPMVENGIGRAVYDTKTFDITVISADGPDLKVRQGRILFTDLDKFDQFTEIDVRVDGPVRAALSLIDHEPLGFARAVGLSPGAAVGRQSTHLNLKFLVERAMTPETIKIAATSEVSGAALPDVIRGLDLSDGNLKLVADNEGMTVAGKVTLGTIGADLTWRQNFKDSLGILSEYQLKGQLNQAQWTDELGLDFLPFAGEFMDGVMGASLIVTRDQEGGGALSANIKLDDVTMAIPSLGWSKAKGVQAAAEVEALFTANKFVRIPRFSIAAPRLTVLGEAGFDEKGAPARIRFRDLRIDDTAVTAIALPRDNGWDIDMRGRNLDLVRWLEAAQDEDDDTGFGDGVPLTVSVNLDRVGLFPDRSLQGVTGALHFDGTVWRTVELDAALGEVGRRLTIRLAPEGVGRRLTMAANDGGATLRAFDFYDNLIGGSFNLSAFYDDSLPHRPLAGSAVIQDFRVVKAPFLTQLLSIASLTGILEALGGEGLAFTNLEVPFQKTNGLITVSDARASGLTLGMTASGTIDMDAEKLDLDGTVVPAYVLNSVLGRIPLIGGLFTGGEEGGGVFAARYQMVGSPDDPKISVNPLSALAPGFLRNLFGIFNEQPPAQAQNEVERPPETTN